MNLAALDKVDDKPLRKSLEVMRTAWREIDDAKVRLSALEKEVAEFLEQADPDDAQALHIASAKRMQIEIIPRLIAKVERNLENDIEPAMVRNLDRFRSALREFYEQAFDVTAEELAKFFKPYFSGQIEHGNGVVDRALFVARQSDDCRELLKRQHEISDIRIPVSHRSNAPQAHDRALCGAAMELLELAARN